MARKRMQAEDARNRILDAAEKRLIEGGPEAVRVQTLAGELGLTDAAIHYHFGSRKRLMEALLRRGGATLKAGLEDADDGSADVGALVARLGEAYRDKGYARLALWLSLEGWQAEGEGMYVALADRLHGARPRGSDLEDTRLAVAVLNVFLFGDTLAGEAFLRSVGLPADERTRKRLRRVAADMIATHLGLAQGS